MTQRASHSEIVVGLMASVSLAVRASATAGNGVLERFRLGGWRWRLRAPVALRRTSNNAVAGKKTPEMVRSCPQVGLHHGRDDPMEGTAESSSSPSRDCFNLLDITFSTAHPSASRRLISDRGPVKHMQALHLLGASALSGETRDRPPLGHDLERGTWSGVLG